MITSELLIHLAKEIAKQDNLDFGTIPMSDEAIYQLLATSLLQKYQQDIGDMDTETRELIYLSSMLKLLTENFVLQYILLSKENAVDITTLLAKYQ